MHICHNFEHTHTKKMAPLETARSQVGREVFTLHGTANCIAYAAGQPNIIRTSLIV